MKIRVLPRAFFETIRGTPDEIALLDNSKIISINSSWGCASEPPFSPALRGHEHLLILNFDDVAQEPETPEDLGRLVMFSPEMAERIRRFVDDGRMPLLVHCAAGISRSGAVGEALNWYFNRYLTDNKTDYNDFIQNNRQILPNPLVRKIMMKVLTG